MLYPVFYNCCHIEVLSTFASEQEGHGFKFGDFCLSTAQRHAFWGRRISDLTLTLTPVKEKALN